MTDSTPRTVAQLTKNPDAEPPRHAYDDPSLGPVEFLLAVMRSKHLPLSVRMDAAARAAPFLTPRCGESRHYPCVGHHLTYVIPDNLSLRQGYEPRTPSIEDPPNEPDEINRDQQSFSSSAST